MALPQEFIVGIPDRLQTSAIIQPMVLLDFDSAPRASFLQGLQKGLAAPYLLFGRFKLEGNKFPSPTLSQTTIEEALAKDWENVGNALRFACAQYGKEHGVKEQADQLNAA
jgi:hypothetical protein